MAHLTCVGTSRSQLLSVLESLSAAGVENVLTLRGDPPADAERFQPHPEGFEHANELMEFSPSLFQLLPGRRVLSGRTCRIP